MTDGRESQQKKLNQNSPPSYHINLGTKIFCFVLKREVHCRQLTTAVTTAIFFSWRITSETLISCYIGHREWRQKDLRQGLNFQVFTLTLSRFSWNSPVIGFLIQPTKTRRSEQKQFLFHCLLKRCISRPTLNKNTKKVKPVSLSYYSVFSAIVSKET